MEPIFTLQYGEFAVADYLSKNIKDASVFIPASAQEKGIDLLLYKFCNGVNLINTIQVKMSRTYYDINRSIKGPCGSTVLYHKTMQIGLFWLGYMPIFRWKERLQPNLRNGIRLCWRLKTMK